MPVTLRAEQPDDVALLTGEEAPFNDFGPRRARQQVAPAELDESGWLIIVDDEGDVAGQVSWHWNDWGPNAASRCPMLGIWVRPECRGRGVGRAAQHALAELFFRHTSVNRVEAHTDVENLAEQRALEAAGFTREGVIRGAQWRDGAFRDGYLYSILRADLTPDVSSRQ
jgi:RimJ/RimL family protein N-acetyltransferase